MSWPNFPNLASVPYTVNTPQSCIGNYSDLCVGQTLSLALEGCELKLASSSTEEGRGFLGEALARYLWASSGPHFDGTQLYSIMEP